VVLVALSRFFDWRAAVVILKPETFLKPEIFVRLRRTAFRIFWHWKSRKRGPPLPKNLRELIQEMGRGNSTFREERIAHELKLKLGIRRMKTSKAALDSLLAAGKCVRYASDLTRAARAIGRDLRIELI